MLARAALTIGALALVGGIAVHASQETASAPTVTKPPTAAGAKPGRAKTPPAAARFASCDAFAAHMRRRALRVVTPYGLPVAPGAVLPVADGPVFDREPALPQAGAAPEAAPVEGRDYSGTNLQEGGVDEPDIVKTDGQRLYTLTDGVVRALEVTPGSAPRPLGTLDLTSIGAQSMMLVNGRLIVFGQSDGVFGQSAGIARPLPERAAPGAGSSPGDPGASDVGPPGGLTTAPDIAPGTPLPSTIQPPRVLVVELDLSNPARMRIRGRMSADGVLIGARRTGTGLRVIVSSSPNPIAADPAELTGAAALRAARRTNRRAVATTTAADWLPRMRIRRLATGKSVNRVIVGCRAVARPRVYSGLGMTTVLTLATDRGLTVTDSDALLTDAQTIYASPTSLYLAAPRWVNPAADTAGRAAPRGTTLIHRLDTSSPTTTVPTSNATVPGYPLNQFALSEYQDHLRVATTQEPEWWSAPAGEEPGQSYVTVLSTANGRLAQTGQVGGLGRNERIYAVRFLGPRGYVVTFRRTDPLYTVDLSDPRAPRVTGELKVNGYSAYLHPIDDDTLIGIGQDATADGVTTGTQVSLFDVSDPARPTRLAQLPLGNGYSEAEDDHLAVLYWAPTGTLAIPLSSWSGPDDREAPFTGAVALTVTRAVGVREQGRIAHPGNWAVRRAAVIGPDLYTVSSGGVGLNRLTDLADEGFTAFR